ncbi:ComF family protein [Thermosynechococcus vestitus]|uniref:Tlr1336 protein n=1 Tax=Thermosynechococcus vestitus (strain NIES-2133 / IAM M-273 / BP-1) TaxID=197221 RepID=Q8DJ92_THEVB|nr:ComF family protein [Thermosynechococcus vestitus]BAC08888.1 tlr1336 [Thermosynechococcus vestitus BP-1]
MWRSLSRFLFQQPCPCCGRLSSQVLCQGCQQRLRAWEVRQRQRYWRGSLPLFPWGYYQQDLKRAIATMKYNNQPELGDFFGQWLALSWFEAKVAEHLPLQIVPIPLHRDKLKSRGFNQAALIAKGFCRTLELPLAAAGLIRQRPTEALFQLSLKERQANLANAFCLGHGLERQRWLLLCDDIYTTGTTARSAATVLRNAGYKVLGIITVAVALPDQLADPTVKATSSKASVHSTTAP